MPVIVACPSCGGKLRIADGLRGQRVRCPACNHTFDDNAKPSPPSQPSSLDPQDLPLQMAIDAPSAPRPAASGPPGLVGAVELPGPVSDVPVPPSEPPPAEPPRRRPSRPWADEPDDWEVPDLRRRVPRRDCIPDRGGVVLAIGIVSLAVLMLVWCAPLGLILGLTSWIMGQSDLRKMKRGEMDLRGRGATQAGWICGIIATILNGLLMLGCGGLIGFVWYEEMRRAPNTRPIPVQNQKPAFPPPPAPQPPGKGFQGR
jgi:predicted Zn finger-like uncharacterized protein